MTHECTRTGGVSAEDFSYMRARVRLLMRDCPEHHHMPSPKPSCPDCARNGGLEAALRILDGVRRS